MNPPFSIPMSKVKVESTTLGMMNQFMTVYHILAILSGYASQINSVILTKFPKGYISRCLGMVNPVGSRAIAGHGHIDAPGL